MSTDPAAMLRQLGMTIRPAGVPGPAVEPAAAPGVGGAAFTDLLRQARDGELTSNLPVKIGRHAGVSLSDDQLAALSLAADRAEAAGVSTALVIMDDQQVLLDVKHRTVTGPAPLGGAGGVLAGIDGVINMSTRPGGGGAERAGVLPLPSGAIHASASLSRLLADREDREQSRASA